jgi:DNA invertase Pin-like site-specific DNA recombinase
MPSVNNQIRPRAFSYLRFSTPEQQKGDSFRRQSTMAIDYARTHNLDLDQQLTFEDLGVSAFRGQNAEAGRLGDFLEAVRAGLVPQGSTLLVEQLDRLSRLTPRKALRVLEDIVDAGITLVTLNDGRAYTAASLDDDQTSLLIAIVTFMRANEESATKARRLKQAWANKREKIGERLLTSKCPAWLRRVGDRFELIPDRADIVRRIFSMTLEGVGQHKITEVFNQEGIKPWGTAKHWQRSYIAKVLANPAVIGTLTPHSLEHDGNRKFRKPLAPIPNYYPEAVSPDVWANCRAMQASGRGPSRGRHASSPIQNVLAGLAVCPICERTMTRVYKGNRSRPSFVCAKAKAGAGCNYRSVPYAYVEEALIKGLRGRLGDTPAGEHQGDLEQAIVNADHTVDDIKDRAANLLDNLGYERSPALMTRLGELEAELEEAEKHLAALLEQREATHGLIPPTPGYRCLKAPEGAEGEGERTGGLYSTKKSNCSRWPTSRRRPMSPLSLPTWRCRPRSA